MKSPRPIGVRIKEKVKIVGDCWIWTGMKNHNGYGAIMVYISPHKHSSELAHRASYRAFVGEIPDGMVITHKCDNRACVNPDHLKATTQLDNIKDMIKKGRQGNTGPNHPNSKLSWDDVDNIRNSDETTRALSERYKVSANAIREARSGRSYNKKLDKPVVNRFENVRLDKIDIDILNAEEFINSIELNGECWNWIGGISCGKSCVTPLARVKEYDEKVLRPIAYRYSYEMIHGKIPDGLLIRHKCDNRLCVNPEHLETGTYQDNTDDMIKRGRAWFSKKTLLVKEGAR